MIQVRAATWLTIWGAIFLAGCGSHGKRTIVSVETPSAITRESDIDRMDWRHHLAAGAFRPAGENEWTTAEIGAEFPFDELIYSWNVRLPEQQGFRLHFRVGFPDGTWSPWLYAGYWGDVELIEDRNNPSFEHGHVAMDQLLLKKKADAYQFKAVDKGIAPLTVLPALTVIGTDNDRVDEVIGQRSPSYGTIPSTVVQDLPLRFQVTSKGETLPGRCQSAALATALEYMGESVPIEDINRWTWDPEYNYPGIWPRTLGAATQLGYDAYIDRFRDWTAVRETLGENKVILASINMPASEEYIDPPYDSMGGHIVALCGITDDGRVLVTDSALREGYLVQWLREDFEIVWMRNKGGVGMVICPPPGAGRQLVQEIAPFPERK